MRFLVFLLIGFLSISFARAGEGIVADVTSAPVHPNGIVENERTGLNIHLQREGVAGLDFMDPAVPGYDLPAGASLEVELVSGFQRDPGIPLDHRSILLVVGAPQQGLPSQVLGLSVEQGENEFTFVIRSKQPDGMSVDQLVSPAPGASLDPIRAKGIKIVHIGRNRAFVNRGEKGVVEVRFRGSNGTVLASGRGEVDFHDEPRPVLFPTNVPHDQRNHNWQRVPARGIVGVASNTLPIPVILYDRNEGLNNAGIVGAGVLSTQQMAQAGIAVPQSLARFDAGLIFRDIDGDGLLNPLKDQVLGGIRHRVPDGASGHQVLSPLVNEKPFLSVETEAFNQRAGINIGGAIMQVVYIAGDVPGLYRAIFTLLERPGDVESPDGSSFTYTIVVQ